MTAGDELAGLVTEFAITNLDGAARVLLVIVEPADRTEADVTAVGYDDDVRRVVLDLLKVAEQLARSDGMPLRIFQIPRSDG